MAAPTTQLIPGSSAVTISTTAEGNGFYIDCNPKIADGAITLGSKITDTNTTAVFAFRGQLVGGGDYFPVALKDVGANSYAANSSSVTLSDTANVTLQVATAGFVRIEVYCVSGTVARSFVASLTSLPGNAPIVVATNNTTGTFSGNVTVGGTFGVTGATTLSSTLGVSGAVTVTSTSASALTVGANGATNPVLKINANTASVATGLSVTGAAAAAGVALTTISSGTNENFTIDAKGSGVLSLNSTATGTVYAGRGAKTGPVFGKTLTSIGTSQSSTPSVAQLLGGVITQTSSTGAGAVTLPTGTAISAAMPLTPATGDSFDCIFANLGGGQTLTITGDTGSTVRGTATVASGTNIVLKFINTGSNTWDVYTNK